MSDLHRQHAAVGGRRERGAAAAEERRLVRLVDAHVQHPAVLAPGVRRRRVLLELADAVPQEQGGVCLNSIFSI